MFKKNLDKFVGARIREYRRKMGLTLEDVSKKLELSLQQIQKYEQGKTRIPLGLLLKLTKIFQLPLNYFYEDYDAFQKQTDTLRADIKLKRTLPLNILMVESDTNDRFILRNTILEFDQKINIYVLDREEHVIAFLKDDTRAYPFLRPDLVFLAMDSQHLNGFSLLKEIKRNLKTRDIPTVMLSNKPYKEDLVKCYKNYANGYIYKCCCRGEEFRDQIQKTLSYWSSICLPHM